MQILNHFQHINLTKDQQTALEKLTSFLESNGDVFMLKGYAGTGKTTLLKGIVEYLLAKEKRFKLMAPTGRAAKVIHQKSSFAATTVHKGIYSFKDLVEVKRSNEKNDVSFLYEYKLRNNADVTETIFIIDEASLVSNVLREGEFFRFGSGNLLHDLFTFCRIPDKTTKNKIIFIGDSAQLPPIGMNFSPALDKNYLAEKYGLNIAEVELKEVKRQEDTNGILQSATKIRRSLTSGYFNDFDLRENQKDIFNPPVRNFLDIYKSRKDKKIIICYKNRTALALNKRIRQEKFGNKNLPIQPKDQVIISMNNYQLEIMNGEFGVVNKAESQPVSREVRFFKKGGDTTSIRLSWRAVEFILPDENNKPRAIKGYILENYLYGDNQLKPEEQRALYIDFKNRHKKLREGTEEFKNAIQADPFFNCIMMKYGYAVTCHKAQGGEWPNAFVFWDRGTCQDFNFYEEKQSAKSKTNSDFYRWAYTAVTRAAQKLYCINPPYFNSFSKMAYVGNDVLTNFDDLTGHDSRTIAVSISEVLPKLEEFGIQNKPQRIQDHFIFRWHHLKDHHIELIDWVKINYEIRYVFKKEAETAAFKYWINGKHKFKEKFQRIPSQTTSDSLFEEIEAILNSSAEIAVDRKNIEGILTKIKFDVEIEEGKPFLRNLFAHIKNSFEENETIKEIEHLDFRERYTIEKAGKTSVFDILYDKKGFFGTVTPIENKCESTILVQRMDEIVNNLKESENVI